MYRTTAALTGLILAAAAVSAQTPEQKAATVKYLQDLQTPDGGFLPQVIDARLDQTPRGSLRATNGALRALKYFGGKAKDPDAAAKFVQKCYDADTGGFGDTPGGTPDVVTTAVGVMATVEVGAKPSPKALAYLAEQAKEFEQIRLAAAAFESAGTRPDVAAKWRTDLLAKANPDGSYGKGAEQPRATGGTVVAILRLGGKVANPGPTLAILNGGQRKDGAWAKDDASGPELETSYRIMRCYHMLHAKPIKADALRAFIAKCRNADGGYGVAPGKPSSVSGTYFAGIILHWLAE